MDTPLQEVWAGAEEGRGGWVGTAAQEGHRLGSILPIIQIKMGAGLRVSDSHPLYRHVRAITQSRWRQWGGGELLGGGVHM